MGNKSTKRITAEEYCSKFKDTPSLTLARKIYNDNPELYNNLEDARSIIRLIRGQHGKTHRNKTGDKSLFSKKAEQAVNLKIPNPYGLPEAEDEDWEPFLIPKSIKKMLVLSDTHIPYHDIQAVTLALDYGKKEGVDAILLDGDILDCYAISRWEKDPRRRSFKGELDDCRKFLSVLKEEFDVPVYYKLGNHENRYEAFLRIKAPELLDIEEFRLDVLLRFREYGVTFIPHDRIIKFGALNIMHGHEFGRSVFSPVNPARGYYMRSKTNILCGHNHQTSEHTESDLNGNITTAWSLGCLCHLHPDYARVNKWNLGFAMLKRSGEKDGFEVDNMKIINGKIR